MIVGRNLDVPGTVGTPQGSVVLMTDVDWAGDVKDRRSCSGNCSLGQGFYRKHVVSRVCVLQEAEHGLFEFW